MWYLRLTGSKYTNLYFINSEEEYDAYWEQVWNKGPREPFSEEAKGYMEYGKTHEDIALSFFLEQSKTLGDIYVAEAPFFPHTLNYQTTRQLDLYLFGHLTTNCTSGTSAGLFLTP